MARKIIDYKLPRTGIVIAKPQHRKVGVMVKWHYGPTEYVSSVRFCQIFRGAPRYEIIDSKPS